MADPTGDGHLPALPLARSACTTSYPRLPNARTGLQPEPTDRVEIGSLAAEASASALRAS
jgi:hypothetical protein